MMNATRAGAPCAAFLLLVLAGCGGGEPAPAEPSVDREQMRERAEAMWLEAQKLPPAGKIRVLRRLVALFPEDVRAVDAHAQLGFWLWDQKRWEEFAKHQKVFARRHPRDLRVAESMRWPIINRIAEAPEGWPSAGEAAAILGEHLRQHRPSAEEAEAPVRSVWMRLQAEAAFGQGQKDAAVAFLREARDLEHGDAAERTRVLWRLGLHLREKGEEEAAVKAFKEALEARESAGRGGPDLPLSSDIEAAIAGEGDG